MKFPTISLLYAATLMLICSGCNKAPQSQSTTSAADHLMQSVVPPEQHFLNKTFSVQKYESFEMQIPAHCQRPRLHGNFRSFHYGDQGNRLNDDASRIDLLLLDEEQFNDFSHGPLQSSTRSAPDTNDQLVDWALPSTFDNVQKYYMVFINSTGKPKTKIVEADMTLSFE